MITFLAKQVRLWRTTLEDVHDKYRAEVETVLGEI